MKIKERLMVAFLIIITIPVIMIAAVGGAIISHQMNVIEKSYNVESNTIQILINPIQVLNRMTRGICNNIETCAKVSPEKLEDERYLDEINRELKEKYSYLVLRKNGRYVYIGDEAEFSPIVENMPAYGSDSSGIDGGYYLSGDHPSLVKQQDFLTADNKKATIFVITDMDTILPQMRSSATQIAVSFILIICFTATILTLWIYSSILRPLNTLKTATIYMREGNLDYEVKAETDDEIGELCEDFDKMRIRLKKLIEERLQYEEESRILISNISHDLKTPLTAIKGYAEGILDGVADTPEKMDKYLRTIYAKASDMSSLVDELSLYTKIDCNAVPYNFTHLNLEQYFSDCVGDLAFDLEVKNIEIGYFNYVDKNQEILADAEQLKRVVNNIVGNSVKYMDKKKGLINIRIQDGGDYVQVEIEDNGKGITKEDCSKIFERFYRTDASRNSSQGGTGLGLSIAKKVIEDHGGQIWATGKEGVGTSIFFTLKKWSQKTDVLEEDTQNE